MVKLLVLSVQVLGRQGVQGDDLYVEFLAPVEQVLYRIGAAPVADLFDAQVAASPAAVPVQYECDMVWQIPAADLALEPPCVQAV